MLTPIIETERLRLRRFDAADTKEVFECWQSDHEVSKYMMWESSDNIADAQEFINYELSMLEADDWYRWCITDKSSGTIFGTCLIFYNEEEACYDISYNLGRKYWGLGYITEAMKAAMDFAVKEIGVKRFVAEHAVENPASGNVIKKLGFQFDHETDYICDGGRLTTTGKKYYKVIE